MRGLRPAFFLLVLALLATADLAAQSQPRPRPMGAAPEVRVDTLPGDSSPGCPRLALGPVGSFEVAWGYHGTPPFDVYARNFSPTGIPTNPAQVEIGPPGNASAFPTVVAAGSIPGGYQVITRVVQGNTVELFLRRLDLGGNPVSGPVQIGGPNALWAWPGPGGTLYVGSYQADGKLLTVRQLQGNGRPAGPPIPVNSKPIDAPVLKLVPVGNGAGDFVAVWTGLTPARRSANARQVIRARVFQGGQPRGKDVDVNVTPGGPPQDFPRLGASFDVAVNPLSRVFTVVWTAARNSFLGAVQGRVFDLQGRPLGPEGLVWGDLSSFVTASYDDGGNLLVLWNFIVNPLSTVIGRLFRADAGVLAPLGVSFGPGSPASGDFIGPVCATAVWSGEWWWIAWTAETSPGGPRAVLVRPFTRGTP